MTCTTSTGDRGGPTVLAGRLPCWPEVTVLDDTGGVHAEMWEIRLRRDAGVLTIDDARRYRACWQALALRRSVGRRCYLPPEVDDLLVENELLNGEIEAERTRQAVEAVFASADTLPA
jgi:hypothetical protein